MDEIVTILIFGIILVLLITNIWRGRKNHDRGGESGGHGSDADDAWGDNGGDGDGGGNGGGE